MDSVFNKFIRNASKINETWQIVEFFENEFKKFRDEVSNYENNILREQAILKKIRSEYLQLQQDIKVAKEELENVKKIDSNSDLSYDNINQPIRALEKVDIRLKDGIVVKANPASDIYSKEVVEKYIASLREVKLLKSKLLEVEFENAKLKNELKESKT